MFWIIIVILMIAIYIAFVVIDCKTGHYDDSLIICRFASGGLAIILSLLLIANVFGEKEFLTKYDMLAQYTENYKYSNEIEKALIANQKYEFNKELIEMKASVKTARILCMFPDEIEKLEYLK